MYLIHSYSHSFCKRDVKAGTVYDVVFRVTDERGNVRQKRLSGFATKQNAEKAFVEYVAKFCTLSEDDCAKGFVTVDKSLSEHTLTDALYEIKSKTGKAVPSPSPPPFVSDLTNICAGNANAVFPPNSCSVRHAAADSPTPPCAAISRSQSNSRARAA